MKRLLAALAVVGLWVLPALPAHAATDPAAYMNTVASHLGDPGVYVDPGVTELSSTEIAELDAAAKSAAAPIRIAVIPASKINTSDNKYYVELAWEGEEIADQLYDRVGVEGVYAVLVDAESESDGRGFHAVQRADHGPTYYAGDAVDQAVDCCAPNYEPMLKQFIERAQVVDKPFYVDAAPFAGGAAGVIGLWCAVTGLGARRERRRDEKAHLNVTKPLLNEEIIALSQQVSALPTVSDPQQSKLSKDVLDTVEKARHRLDEAKGDEDIEAVTTLLGSARYGMVCLEAVRSGRPIPEPTAPCFFDPRHGPSTDQIESKPKDGAARAVDVCAACKQRDEAGEQPQIRMVKGWQISSPYWEHGEDLAAYVDGYWSRGDGSAWWFPDNDFKRRGEQMRSRWRSRRPGGRFRRFGSNVGSTIGDMAAASSSGSGDSDSSWYGGSNRRSSWSSRTRSSGGGSSRRSSRRSGGSRGF
ncbi:hypothetical protein ACWGID_13885 [Kribbella sp. NPDC054772]